MRIVLVRHGRPAMGRSRWIGHAAFKSYIDDYQAAGIEADPPPPELIELVEKAPRVFASDLKRSIDSARTLLPKAEIVSTAVFTEAPLASPRLPALRMKAPAWAVVARVAWHGGFKPGIESYGQSKQRARLAAPMLIEEAERSGLAVLVAHGYFNAILGRTLRLRGWRRVSGSHRARFWNTVIYERDTAVAPPPKRGAVRRLIGRRKPKGLTATR
ncbi:MAG: hypothetical protein QM698_16655 [Micropepsaceae bacterium]